MRRVVPVRQQRGGAGRAGLDAKGWGGFGRATSTPPSLYSIVLLATLSIFVDFPHCAMRVVRTTVCRRLDYHKGNYRAMRRYLVAEL